MKAESLAAIPLYPELRNCLTPSAPRILEIFSGIQRRRLMHGDDVVQVFEPQPTPLQLTVLDLLHVSVATYTSVGAI